jgi:hypothetical protein
MIKKTSIEKPQQSKVSVFLKNAFKVLGCFMIVNILIIVIILAIANSSGKEGSHHSHHRHHIHHSR